MTRQKEILITKILEEVKLICDDLGLTPILTSGSLLGAHRDGGIITGDDDDIDFVLPQYVAQYQLTDFVNTFLKAGYEIKLIRETVVSFRRINVHVDFNFYREKDADRYMNIYYKGRKRFCMYTPKRFWDELGEIEFMGQFFACPKDIEGFLEWKYGDWRTPVLRPNFNVLQCFDREGLAEWL